MKKLLFIVVTNCMPMGRTPPQTPAIKPMTKYIFVDERLEKQTRFHSKKLLTEPLVREDFIECLKTIHPEYFTGEKNEIQFTATLRGSSFEVLHGGTLGQLNKAISTEIEDEIIKELIEKDWFDEKQ